MSLSTDELEKQFICAGCVGEPCLSGKIGSDGEDKDCSYCGEVNPDTVRVHMVNAVRVDTSEFDVQRHRWQKQEPPF